MSIEYPPDWFLEGHDRFLDDKVVGAYDFAEGCPKILANPNPEFSQFGCLDSSINLHIDVSNLPPNMTLNEFVTSYLGMVKLDQTDFRIINSTTNDTLSGIPAYSIEYTVKREPFELTSYEALETVKFYEIIAVKADRGYGIRYNAGVQDFDKYLPAVKEMAASLEILPMPPCKYVKDEYSGKCVM
jgi:hypothetical protein